MDQLSVGISGVHVELGDSGHRVEASHFLNVHFASRYLLSVQICVCLCVILICHGHKIRVFFWSRNCAREKESFRLVLYLI